MRFITSTAFSKLIILWQKSFQIHLEEGSPDDIRAVMKGPNSNPQVRISWIGKIGHGSFTPVETGPHKVRTK